MDVSGWLRQSKENMQNYGLFTGTMLSARPVYNKIKPDDFHIRNSGENIYYFEWDLLIVLDACRFDLMKDVASEYEFIDELDSIWSVAGVTPIWMEKTFQNRLETKDTIYVCGNPFSERKLDSAAFDDVIEVWKDVWEEPGTVPPQGITNELIRLMRDDSVECNRVIAHYMQPHCPFLSNPDLSKGAELDKFGNQDHKDVWQLSRDGALSDDDVWDAYRGNLTIVLENIRLLLDNVNAETVVITSDHGNAVGELGLYGHYSAMPLKVLRKVPWITTTASDSGEYTPEDNFERTEVSKEEKLKALGYL